VGAPVFTPVQGGYEIPPAEELFGGNLMPVAEITLHPAQVVLSPVKPCTRMTGGLLFISQIFSSRLKSIKKKALIEKPFQIQRDGGLKNMVNDNIFLLNILTE
jgi:hypothetical protein